MRSKLVVVAGCIMLAACGGKPVPVAVDPRGKVTLLSELPSPGADDVAKSTRLAFVGPFNELRVEVFGIADLQRDIMTDGEGNFSFPLIGAVQSAGKTTAEVAESIRSRLAGRYVRNPQVVVNFKSSTNPLAMQSQSVSVDGQVSRPGQFPVVGRMTLMRAVAMAGGLTEFAKLDDVLIFRNVGTQQFVGIYNIGAIRRGNYVDPEVYSNDIIVVGDSPQRRAFRDFLQAAPLLSSPIIVLGNQL